MQIELYIDMHIVEQNIISSSLTLCCIDFLCSLLYLQTLKRLKGCKIFFVTCKYYIYNSPCYYLPETF